jgi:hypothetical protein
MNREHPVSVPSAGLALSGLLGGAARAGQGVVVAHPHPLYGGDMHNPVVAAIVRAYARSGWRTLRFDFRGVAASQGVFDGGRGEVDDLLAAAEFLHRRGAARVDLAGYSFGAWVVARAPQRPCHGQRLLVAPPVALLDFGGIAPPAALRGIISGARDRFAPPAELAARLTEWNVAARADLLPGADHFFSGCLAHLEAAIAAKLSTA